MKEWVAGEKLTAKDLNDNFIKASAPDYFGDGSDGDVVISSNTTLTGDKNYTSLTINAGVELNCNGYKIHCSGKITNNGTIKNNGGAGGDANYTTRGIAGVGAGGGSLEAGLDGKIGGSAGGNGVNGENKNPSIAGENGANGGTNSNGGGTGGTGGTATVENAKILVNNFLNDSLAFGTENDVKTMIIGGEISHDLTGSASSGSGAGGSSWDYAGGAGGGSGGNGGIVYISAKEIENNGNIEAKGGNGGRGGNAGGPTARFGSGGGGGQGGLIVLLYQTITLGTLVVTGGTGGLRGAVGYGAGGVGQNGKNGKTILVKISSY